MPPALITYDTHTVYLHEAWAKTGRVLATHFGSPHLALDLVQKGNLLRLGETVAKCVSSPGGLLPPANTVYSGLGQLPEYLQSIWETHYKYDPATGWGQENTGPFLVFATHEDEYRHEQLLLRRGRRELIRQLYSTLHTALDGPFTLSWGGSTATEPNMVEQFCIAINRNVETSTDQTFGIQCNREPHMTGLIMAQLFGQSVRPGHPGNSEEANFIITLRTDSVHSRDHRDLQKRMIYELI